MTDMTRHEDEILVVGARLGDSHAWQQIVDIHGERLLDLVLSVSRTEVFRGRREFAEDVVQETFFKAHIQLEKYDPSKGSIATWLNVMAVHLTINFLNVKEHRSWRKVYIHNNDDERNPLDRIAGFTLAPHRCFSNEELLAKARDAVGNLPVAQALAVLLHCFCELSYGDIAEFLDVPVPTVRTHVHRGRLALRDQIMRLNSGKSVNAPQGEIRSESCEAEDVGRSCSSRTRSSPIEKSGSMESVTRQRRLRNDQRNDVDSKSRK